MLFAYIDEVLAKAFKGSSIMVVARRRD